MDPNVHVVQPGSVAITMEPYGGSQWMARPTFAQNCPPGLEYLTQIDQLLIHQELHLVEVFCNWEKKNRYAILNSAGQQCYYAFEESECCERQYCGNMRSFRMRIVDNSGVDVLQMQRPFICCGGGSCCIGQSCQQEISVTLPDGTPVGSVRTQPHCCAQEMTISDPYNQNHLTVSGPCPVCKWCLNEFDVQSNGDNVGYIGKTWAGAGKELCSNASHFQVSFPMSMDVKMKATMLGAAFLIDFMFFEHDGN